MLGRSTKMNTSIFDHYFNEELEEFTVGYHTFQKVLDVALRETHSEMNQISKSHLRDLQLRYDKVFAEKTFRQMNQDQSN